MANKEIKETDDTNEKEKIFEYIQNLGWSVFYLIIVNVMINIFMGIVLVVKIIIGLVKAIM